MHRSPASAPGRSAIAVAVATTGEGVDLHPEVFAKIRLAALQK